jgi:hypothetical protein
MNKKELLEKIISKKEFSDLPKEDVEFIFEKFNKKDYVDEEKVKLTRDLLRKVYSVFTSGKLLNKKIIDKKSYEEILKKHLSTKERYDFYEELYKKVLNFTSKKDVSIIDLGAGINGLSYSFFEEIKNKNVNYLGIEAVGQLVRLMNYFFDKSSFDKNKVKALHESLFDLDKIMEIVKKQNGFKIVFLFKVLDSLEMIERNYSKKLIEELSSLTDIFVVSFATKSLTSKKNFSVKRYWFENFLKNNFEMIGDFVLGSERYIIFRKA